MKVKVIPPQASGVIQESTQEASRSSRTEAWVKKVLGLDYVAESFIDAEDKRGRSDWRAGRSSQQNTGAQGYEHSGVLGIY